MMRNVRQWSAVWFLTLGVLGLSVASSAARAQGRDVENDPLVQNSQRNEAANDRDHWFEQWAQPVGALALVIALIFALRYALRRLRGSRRLAGDGEILEVLARSTPMPRQHLLLVRVGRRIVLIGSGPEGMVRLSEITDPQEVASVTAACGAESPSGPSEPAENKTGRSSTASGAGNTPQDLPPDRAAQRLAEKLRSHLRDKGGDS